MVWESLGLYFWGHSLSDRVYLPNGTLWATRDYSNFVPSCSYGDKDNRWGRLRRFHGRTPEEIRFKPGDIVEVFGFPGNEYWDANEVNIAVVVACPPTKDEVSKKIAEHLATHSAYDDTCERALLGLFRSHQDCYTVISEACEGIDYSPTIATFRPTLKVTKQRERKMKALYEQFKKQQNYDNNT